MHHFATGEGIDDGEVGESTEFVELVETLAFAEGVCVWIDEMLDDDEVLLHDLVNEWVAEQVAIDRTRLEISLFLGMNDRYMSNE